jgi:hypothetical protein
MMKRAWAEPERYEARPLKRNPPSTGSACAVSGLSEPAMSACESRQMVAKVSGPQKRANNEPEQRIVRTHPVDESSSDTRSKSRTPSGMVRPRPPSSLGTNVWKRPASWSASTTAGAR